jgi:hypothetical protein
LFNTAAVILSVRHRVEQDVKLGSTRSVWKRDVSWGVIESLGVEICRKARD